MSRPTPPVVRGALAVVTGAGSGIGRATSLALHRAGARVVALDVDGASAAATAGQCGGTSAEVDVGDAGAMEETARHLAATVGTPDILVNNAGVGMSGRFLDTSLEDWEWILSVNLMGVVNGCRAFGPGMVARGSGHVVNVSSGLGYAPRATEPAYVTTKAAVLALSRCLRADWGPSGVGVSVVCPGVIDTPIVERTRFLGERGRAETVAGVRRVFARGHPASAVADAVVRAVERDRAVVPVGVEARAAWALHGLLPAAAVDRAARATLGGV